MVAPIVGWLLQVVIGLALAGLVMAVILPLTGASAGPLTAVAVALCSLLLVMLVWRWCSRPRDGDIARR